MVSFASASLTVSFLDVAARRVGRAEIGRRDALVAADLARCPGRDERAEVQDVDLVAELEHQAHVVVDQQDGHAGVPDLAQPLRQPRALRAVQPGRRLVEQQQPRLPG